MGFQGNPLLLRSAFPSVKWVCDILSQPPMQLTAQGLARSTAGTLRAANEEIGANGNMK